VADPDSRADDYKALASRALSREAVLADPEIRKSVFELLDEVWSQDHRIKWTS
jgi:3-hydroxyacyl-CoA dehydrogenase